MAHKIAKFPSLTVIRKSKFNTALKMLIRCVLPILMNLNHYYHTYKRDLFQVTFTGIITTEKFTESS
jgi:hypothetical protein